MSIQQFLLRWVNRLVLAFVRIVAVAVALAPVGVSAVDADDNEFDTVVLSSAITREWDSWKPPTTSVLRGTISGFTHEKLWIETQDGRNLQLPSARVSRVKLVFKDPDVAAANGLVDDHKYEQSLAAINNSYQRAPTWQQPLLIAKVVRSLDAIGRDRSAGVIFGNLTDAVTPPAVIYADMPLCWTSSQVPNRQHAEQATKWLVSENESLQLLGASWLLLASNSGAAGQVLTKLKSSSNKTLSQLAVAQSWRLVPPPMTMEELPSWLAYRDNLLEPLQIGPTEFIADRLSRIGNAELATGQWIRIASVNNSPDHRAADALEAAAEQLRRIGKDEQAGKLDPWIEKLRE